MSPLLPVCARTGKTATSKTSSTAVFVSLVTTPGEVRHRRGFSEVVIEQCIPFTPQFIFKCWFSFNRRHALGPKDRKLVAGPALRGGRGTPSSDSPKGPKGRHKPWRTFGAQVTNGHISPPSRTGLLTSGPSDLRVQTEPLPNVASLKVLEKAGYICEGLMRRSAIKDGVVLDQFMYAKTVE